MPHIQMSPKAMKRLTLDQMLEYFRDRPTPPKAIRLREVALGYWEDEMIGDESLLAILKEIKDS